MKIYTNEEKDEMIDDAIKRIKAGEVITVHDASGSALSLCIGDFRDCGWAEKMCGRTSLCWYWTGPTAIIIGSHLTKPNSLTPETDMDWS